eukprot:1299190-Rhodomonas_salina.1
MPRNITSLQNIHVPGVGRCIVAIEFIAMVSGKSTKQAQGMIHDISKGTHAADICGILCRKFVVPGFTEPNYVITYEEAFELINFMPRKHVKHIQRQLSSFFCQNQTEEDLDDTIVKLGKRKESEATSQSGYVYAAYSHGNGLKIGMTCKDDPMLRVRSLNTGVRDSFKLIDSIRCGNPSDLEHFMHCRFKNLHVEGNHNQELFHATPEMAIDTFNVVRKAAVVLQTNPDDPIDIKRLKGYFNFAAPKRPHCRYHSTRQPSKGTPTTPSATLYPFHLSPPGLGPRIHSRPYGLTKKECHTLLFCLTKPTTAASKRQAAEALLSRCHVIPGFDNPTPLVTFQEGMQLVRLLPAKHVGHVLNHIDSTFQGVEAGDSRIVDRVVENASSDAVINRVARDGLGLPRDAMIEDPVLKKRMLLADI